MENAVSAYRTSHRSLGSLRSLGMTGTLDASLGMTVTGDASLGMTDSEGNRRTRDYKAERRVLDEKREPSTPSLERRSAPSRCGPPPTSEWCA